MTRSYAPTNGLALSIAFTRGLPALALAVTLSFGCAAKSSDIAMHEGLVAHQKGDFSVAKLRYERALKLEPKIKGAQTNLAAIALQRDDVEAALKALAAELEIRAEDPDAKLVRAFAYLRTDRVDKALEDAEPLAKLGGGLPPETVSGYVRRTTAQLLVAFGRLLKAPNAREGDSVQAVWDALNPVIGLDMAVVAKAKVDAPLDALAPLKMHARRLGGMLAITTGKPERGLELLTADATEKKAAPYPVLRLYALVALGRAEEALGLVAQAEAGPLRESPWAKVLRGHALALLDRHLEVPKVVAGLGADASLSAPLRASALRLMAGAHARKSEWTQAVKALEDASAVLGSKNVPADLWLDQAVALAQVGRVDDARRTVSGVLRDEPNHPRALTLEGLLK